MGPISITANAGLEIIRKLASGELEVHGILLRDTEGKKFRYILRGFEDLPKDIARLGELPPLEPLRAAVNMTQLLQVISIAQNAAIAASLRRIEARITAIEDRLSDIQGRLTRMQTTQMLTLDAIRAQPVSRLKAAKTAAVVALQLRDRTALIGAGKDAQQAFHDLLEQARHLVSTEEDGVPVALRLPDELADLCESAADAAYVASAIWIALDSQHEAAKVTRETAEALRSMRRKLSTVLADPEFLLRRMKTDEGRDAALQAAGRRLQSAMQASLGRSLMIEQGLVAPDPEQISFERDQRVQELAFLPLPDTISGDP
jgi:predicted metal-binding protein